MKMFKTIRFDQSDERVFERAAEVDEWAVSGAGQFAAMDVAKLAGKARQAFANGFLGTTSLGRSTFVVVASADDDMHIEIAKRLARTFVDELGAPDGDVALEAAQSEVAFARDLAADLAVGSVMAVSRAIDDESQIVETFRVVRQGDGVDHVTRLWSTSDDA